MQWLGPKRSSLLLTRVIAVVGGANAVNTGSGGGAGPQSLLDPFFARMVWREMLQAVDHIHAHRIVHGEFLNRLQVISVLLFREFKLCVGGVVWTECVRLLRRAQ
jgi:hypothetical protein